MQWLKKIFKINTPQNNPSTTSPSSPVPPWILHPTYPPSDGFWRQTGEEFLFAWLGMWQALTKSEREQYLKQWTVPEDWRVDFFEDNWVFREWVYGITCKNKGELVEQLGSELKGLVVKSVDVRRNSYLSIDLDQWKIIFPKAAWQLKRKEILEIASSDDPELIEQNLEMLKNAEVESFKSKDPYNDMIVTFTGEIVISTFLTQAIVDLSESDQWKLYTPYDTVLSSGAGKNLRYEISSPLTF